MHHNHRSQTSKIAANVTFRKRKIPLYICNNQCYFSCLCNIIFNRIKLKENWRRRRRKKKINLCRSKTFCFVSSYVMIFNSYEVPSNNENEKKKEEKKHQYSFFYFCSLSLRVALHCFVQLHSLYKTYFCLFIFFHLAILFCT